MATLSERISRFRQRVEQEASAPPDEPRPNGNETPPGVVRRVRKGIERGQAAGADLKTRAETDLQRAQDRIERRVVPLEDKAAKAADELRELQEGADELRVKVAKPLEEQRASLKAEVDMLKEQFGGLNTDLDDMGTDVEEPLLFDAVDDPDRDGDLFETIDDPLADVDAAASVDVNGFPAETGSIEAFEADLSGGIEEDFEDL